MIYGGQSGEHEISCISATYLEQTIRAAGFAPIPIYVDRHGVWHWQSAVSRKPHENSINPAALVRLNDGVVLRSATNAVLVDFAFPIIHGPAGEDGSLQGYFEVLGLPYAGTGVASSAVSMDKALMRAVFAAADLPQVKYFVIENAAKISIDTLDQRITSTMQYPVFIKPCNMGSSVGVHKVKSRAELTAALVDAARFDDHLLCEEGLSVRELEIAIAGNYPEYITSGVGEIQVNHEFYSYDAKYVDPNGAVLLLKAPIDARTHAQIETLAKCAFKSVRGEGFARIDFFLDKNSGKVYLNEINTLPGFTPISMFPQLFAAAGKSGAEMTRLIIRWGEERCKRLFELRLAAR
ncbi:MAG TPA: D-alanine--D-alanine ligase family protein [Turneriella sp.]|nr:D-alanine--D-alanine ligase family protein [Turneriella sp.]